MPLVYAAVKRFDPASGEAWQKYIAWSRLTQLREAISLDGILCPTLFQQLTADDWQHNVQEDFKTTLFHDLDYVVRKVAGDERVNVPALLQNPTDNEVRSFREPISCFSPAKPRGRWARSAVRRILPLLLHLPR